MILQPGYAIEYDYFDPTWVCSATLETKAMWRAVLCRPDQRDNRV